jgi:hypothetical protein
MKLERKLKDAELERDILKAIGIFSKRSMIYVFIKTMKRYFRLKRCAKFSTLVKVIINGKANLFLIGNKELCLLKKITSIYFESKQRYGSPRMTVELLL